jgi:oligopeptide/dipeptide ABC transporter ATP-binding protein
MIYQDPMSSLNPLQPVGRQVAEAIAAHEDLGGREARGRTVETLRDVGLPQPERRFDDYPHQFSGGMRQRVMIAMAIATNPDVLIADEPTTALDVTTQARIMELLDRIVDERGMGVILITHDLGLASSFCEDMHVMYGGRIVESGDASAVLNSPAHPYSEALLESICTIDRDVDRPIAAISGQPPLPDQLPSGCPFHPRCTYAQDLCADVAPPPIPVDGRLTECHFPLVQEHS